MNFIINLKKHLEFLLLLSLKLIFIIHLNPNFVQQISYISLLSMLTLYRILFQYISSFPIFFLLISHFQKYKFYFIFFSILNSNYHHNYLHFIVNYYSIKVNIILDFYSSFRNHKKFVRLLFFLQITIFYLIFIHKY